MGWGVGVAVFGVVDGAGQCLVLAQVVVVLVGMCRQGRGGAGMHLKGADLRGGPRSGWTGSGRRLIRGWGRLLSVTIGIEAGTWRQGGSAGALDAPWRRGVLPCPPSNASLGGGGGLLLSLGWWYGT